MPPLDRLLLWVALAHALVALGCLGLLQLDAAPILAVHPALKPFKFASSIAAFLLSMSVLLPALSTSAGTRRALSIALASSLVLEMAIIGGQALRGRRSHFNLESPFDAALTRTMILGIVVLTLAMLAIALLATTRSLAQPALLTAAWRAALWLFLFGAVSGFNMGGRAGHTVGSGDGGAGMALTNWSRTHGDLRVSHFFALHALQLLPLLALAVSRLPFGSGAQWTLVAAGIGANAALAGWTWLQALAARPFG